MGQVMKTCICIVLYNKFIEDSVTFRKLKGIGIIDNDDFQVVVVNNGPKSVSQDANLKEYNVVLEEYLNNKPLSHVYNDLFKKHPQFERYLILDDDTSIQMDFFSDIEKYYYDGVDLQIPVIMDGKGCQRFYPLINKNVVSEKLTLPITLDNSDSLLSVGSGMIIYRSLIKKFESMQMELFDRRYALYGVDFSLFRRIKLLGKNNVQVTIQIPTTLRHSLSRVDSDFSAWRHLERVYDYALSARFYSKSFMHMIIGMAIFLGKELAHCRFKHSYLLVLTFLRGKHPRC